MSNNAVLAIKKIYSSNPGFTAEVLAALGQAGGDLAVSEIMKIYSRNPSFKAEVLAALGPAGRSR